jgi:hypothetical protein
MTLLIGTVSKTNVVLTADGLSTPNPITGQGISSSSYQKIFPLPKVPVAIAHHGLNIINGREVAEVIDDFSAQNVELIGKTELINITNALIQFVDIDAKVTLEDPTNKGVIGFWVSGFCPGKSNPELFETCWPDDVTPQKHGNLVIGGGGQEFIKPFLNTPLGPFSPDKVYTFKSTYARQYHAILYKRAESRQAKQSQSIFGGQKQQLVISRKECVWTIGPP